MRADYDSEADALSIDLIEAERWDDRVDEPIHDDYCCVAFAGGQPANIEVLYPGEHPEHLDLLDAAAARYGLDAEELRALAMAALAAPDRVVTLELGVRQTGSAEPLSG